MKSILEDIKTQNFKQAYLLYGEEAYLKHQYKNKLKNALLPEDDLSLIHISEPTRRS